MDCMEPTDSASWALASTMRAWVAVTDSATVELRVEFWRAGAWMRSPEVAVWSRDSDCALAAMSATRLKPPARLAM